MLLLQELSESHELQLSQILSLLSEQHHSNLLSQSLAILSLLELYKSNEVLHDSVKSLYLMQMVSHLGQHMLHELLRLVLLVDQVDTSLYLVMDEMDSIALFCSKHELV